MLAAQKDHLGRQPAARGDPSLHPRRIRRIQHHGCFAISEGAAVDAEIIRGMETKRRTRGHADFAMRDRAEDDGAGLGTETVNDHGLSG